MAKDRTHSDFEASYLGSIHIVCAYMCNTLVLQYAKICRLWLGLDTSIGLLRLFVECAAALDQWRMREVIPRVPWVRVEVSLVFFMDLLKATLECIGPSIGQGKAVRLEFKGAAKHRHEQLQNVFSGFEQHRENHERDHNRICITIAELANDTLGNFT